MPINAMLYEGLFKCANDVIFNTIKVEDEVRVKTIMYASIYVGRTKLHCQRNWQRRLKIIFFIPSI